MTTHDSPNLDAVLADADVDVDVDLMRVLHHLLQTRSVTRTAELLGVSQPTVSRSLARLRNRLADPLLVQSGGGMVPTHRAESLCEPLRQWIAQGQALLSPQTFDPGKAVREFRVASTDFGVLRIIRPKLRRLAREAPHCGLSIEPLDGNSIRKLSSPEIDLVITGFEPSGPLYARRLFTETVSCVVRDGHPLAADPKVCLEALAEWPHIVVTIAEVDADWLGAALKTSGLRPRVALRAEGFTLAPHLIAGTDGVAALPTSAAVELARIHQLTVLELPCNLGTFDYWLVWHERARKDAGVAWLVDLLADGSAPRTARQ